MDGLEQREPDETAQVRRLPPCDLVREGWVREGRRATKPPFWPKGFPLTEFAEYGATGSFDICELGSGRLRHR